METQNFGKLKFGIDWENKGWVSFNQDTFNTDNILTKSRFFDTQYGSQVSGDAVKKQSIVPLGLYGLENVDINFNTAGAYSLGLGNITGTPNIPVIGSHDYTFWYWLSSFDDYTNDGGHIFRVSIQEFNAGVLVTSHDDYVDLTGDSLVNARYISLTTDSTTDYITFVLYKNDTDASQLRVTLHGVLLFDTIDTVEPVWGNGEAELGTLLDNVITPYVLNSQGSIGKAQWETILFDEGQLTLTLNNADRRFSPEYVDGAYFTYLKPYLRVWVAVEDSFGIYRLLWSGWTHQFQLQTGNKGTRQATITARQGKYNIEAQDADSLVATADNLSVNLIVDLFSGGYAIPSQSEATITPSSILQEYDEIGVTVPIFGVEFVEKPNDKKYLASLEHVAELNGNYIFLTRQGRVVFKTYQSVKDTIPDELPYSLTKSAEYVYSPSDLYKQIVVNYTEYLYANSIEMQGQEFVISTPATDFPFSIRPQYNGMPLIGDVVLDVSSFLPTDYNTVPSMGSASSTFVPHYEGLYTWYSALAQNSTDLDYRLSVVSRDSGNVWYAANVNQVYNVVGISDISLDTLSYNNPLIVNETMATDFANMQINRRASIVSWFNRATLENKNAEAVDWILNHSVGDVIYMAEEQSGDVFKHLIIVGEHFNYTPGHLQMSYDIAPTGAEVDVAAFTYVVNGQNVDFIDQSDTSLPPDFLWDFGD